VAFCFSASSGGPLDTRLDALIDLSGVGCLLLHLTFLLCRLRRTRNTERPNDCEQFGHSFPLE